MRKLLTPFKVPRACEARAAAGKAFCDSMRVAAQSSAHARAIAKFLRAARRLRTGR